MDLFHSFAMNVLSDVLLTDWLQQLSCECLGESSLLLLLLLHCERNAGVGIFGVIPNLDASTPKVSGALYKDQILQNL